MNRSIKKIAIIGGGNIGTAIATGFSKKGIFGKDQITLTRLPSQSLNDLKKEGFSATHDNKQAVAESELIIITVQPKQAKQVFSEIKDVLDKSKHTILSVVSALTLDEMEKIVGNQIETIRVMPNTAISVCESMTCISAQDTETDRFKEIKYIFDQVGQTLVIDEKLMSAATVLAACGTGFFLRIIRASSQGGIQVGFHADEAQLIAAQVAKGATSLILETGNHPEAEIDKVTTPQGLTIKGLNEMEHAGLSSAIIKGIVHSYSEMDKLIK